MPNRHIPGTALFAAGHLYALRLYQSRRARKVALGFGLLLLLFGLLGLLAAPPLIRGQLQTRLGDLLQRPVSLAAVQFNPFTLNLGLDNLHIGDADGHAPFVDIDHVTINAAWSSLVHGAPVLDELVLQHPQLHITRTAAQQFNFSDLIARLSTGPKTPGEPPPRFSLSNISVHAGNIRFADQVQHTSHRIDQIELGIPFIANLRHDTDVFVRPLLAMRVDGSPLRIDGQTKPFADGRESVLGFTLDHLDLPRYVGYVPVALPIGIPRGQLSGQLNLHFLSTQAAPELRLSGRLQLDNFALTGRGGAPLLELGHASATLADLQPLLSRYHLDAVQLQQAVLHYVRSANGHSNLDALTGADSAPTVPAAPASPAPETDLRIAALTVAGGRFEYADHSGRQPAVLNLANLHGTVRRLSTTAATVGSIDLAAQLAGGTARVNGQLNLATGSYDGRFSLHDVALAPLVPLAPPLLDAEITRGRLDASGQLQASWGKAFNLRLASATIAVNDLALGRHDRTPVAWQALNAEINHLDLARSEARFGHVAMHGLHLDVRRQRDGSFELSNLLETDSPARHQRTAAPNWRWGIGNLRIDGSTLDFQDLSTLGGTAGARMPRTVTVKADKFDIEGLSDNLHQPLQLDLAGGIGRGTYHAQGSVKPLPLDVDLRVQTTRLDVAAMQSLLSVPLNVRIARALLSARGRLRYRDHGQQPLVDYRGQLTFGQVRVQDKLTGDDFLRWQALNADGVNLRMGGDVPHVSVAGLALSDFYARVIINASGRTNLQDVVTNPAAAPVSVTQAQATATPAPPPVAAAAAPAADIHIGQITLARGHLNYTDNYIKPNYTANITQLDGRIGAFGTAAGGPPAGLTLQGQLDDNAPVNIDGTINPLAPVAFLDVKAKADGVELTHLSPYSGKYAGYPITKGRLTMDVHYLLEQGKLTADNHLFIDQLTFGDRIDGPGIKHLPVKLAVALLRNAQGQIDLHIPVTGSLDDPQFSVGSLVWHAFVNLIGRAVTSPFRLLASIGGGSHPDLGFVEFAPGSDVIDATALTRLPELVKLLADKPTLKLDITGRVDPKFDESGLRQVMVEQLIHQELRDDRADADTPVAKLSPDDYERYLEKAYRHAKFPKPRNFIGLTRSQPPEVMQKLLETNMQVDQDALRHLAERRADAVRLWLRGKIDDQRVFVLAPKLDAKGIGDKGKTTRVDFGLR